MLITDKLIQQYVWGKLSYKESVLVIAWKRFDNFIHIMFDDFGETIFVSNYLEWLSNRRNSKIDSLLD